MHTAAILLGSNIHPEENIANAFAILKKEFKLLKTSQIWETEAIGSGGPDFLNSAILVETPLIENDIK